MVSRPEPSGQNSDDGAIIMEKVYHSTRSTAERAGASEAIARGLAPDGGLYVPAFLDEVHFDLEALKDLSYPDLAETILSAFLDFDQEQLDACIDGAYKSGKFDINTLVQTTPAGEAAILELYHGPTAAFKDMALTILPYLVTASGKNTGEDREIVILTATSGDTGKAALEGFKDVPGTKIVVFYPEDGVSTVQERQMITTGGDNTHVVGVEGNFDDTQSGVKAIFSDLDLADQLSDEGFVFSSANSINIGRLLPQIVYYYKAYFDLVDQGRIQMGDPVNFSVPTGNFGDILAGYYAMKTGLPVNRLICASNQNKILTDFFESGVYDRNREFHKSISPSMDILISSNLERLLFDKCGRDARAVEEMMDRLAEEGVYETDKALFPEFFAGYATEDETRETIRDVFENTGELIDPHTAVAEKVRRDYVEATGDDTMTVVLSTASPFKFSQAVYESLYGDVPEELDAFSLQEDLAKKTGAAIPAPLRDLDEKPIRHNYHCEAAGMKDAVVSFLSEE